MAKPLSQLIDKLDPAVVAAARQKADKEIFELRLAMLREELAVSQVELAKRLGIQFSIVSANPPSPIWKSAAAK